MAVVDEIILALKNLGGRGTHDQIFSEYSKFGSSNRSTVRRTIYQHSSDSDAYTRKRDHFNSVYGIGRGVWELRGYKKDTPDGSSNSAKTQKKDEPALNSPSGNGIVKNRVEDIAEEDDELAFPEGREIYHLHRSKERNKALVDMVKANRLAKDPDLCCDACGFSFVQAYGPLGLGFIEAHHIVPLADLKEETQTRTDDLVLVCSNCHRMLHRKRPWIDVGELKTKLSKQTRDKIDLE